MAASDSSSDSSSGSIILHPYRELKLHHHELILNEDYHSHEGKICYGCCQILHISSAVYRCINFSSAEDDDSAEEDDSEEKEEENPAKKVSCAQFFIHKSCAHLPSRILHRRYRRILQRESWPRNEISCKICGIKVKGIYYSCGKDYRICLLCVIPLKQNNIYPAYHSHELALSTRYATFQCDACHQVDTDFSYTCHTCPFYIHLACSNLPDSLQCKNHRKHPLRLAYSLPDMYRKFPQYCTICTRKLYHGHWLHYCPNCRFFAHVKCATTAFSHSMDREPDAEEPDLVNLPAPDHESLLQQCIRKKIVSWLEAALVTPLHINHWSHERHEMVLKNRSGSSTTDDEGLLVCNGCTKSISPGDDSGDVFYECSECEFILHRYCALFPEVMPHELERSLVGIQPSVNDIWTCTGCQGLRNGTQMGATYLSNERSRRKIVVKLDAECALLPKLVKHKFHPHLLAQFHGSSGDDCFACHTTRTGDALLTCIRTSAFSQHCPFVIHMKCALKPLQVTHRWDRHPLYLISSPEEVQDHPHEFQCEFCSEEIDTNCWFYHCSVCDLSFHLGECIDLFPYSRVKFGATNIKTRDHHHGLTFVLNKKRQPCQRCHKDTYGKPVLECNPCKFTQHAQPDLCS